MLNQLHREIQMMKKSCADLNFEAKEKLKTFHFEIDDVSKDVPALISQMHIIHDHKKKMQTCEFLQLEKNNFDTLNQIASLNEHYNKLKSDFCDRENAFNCIQREYELLKRKYDELRCQAESTYTVIGDSQFLQNALTEIAKIVISDFGNDSQKSYDSILDSFARKIRYSENIFEIRRKNRPLRIRTHKN